MHIAYVAAMELQKESFVSTQFLPPSRNCSIGQDKRGRQTSVGAQIENGEKGCPAGSHSGGSAESVGDSKRRKRKRV